MSIKILLFRPSTKFQQLIIVGVYKQPFIMAFLNTYKQELFTGLHFVCLKNPINLFTSILLVWILESKYHSIKLVVRLLNFNPQVLGKFPFYNGMSFENSSLSIVNSMNIFAKRFYHLNNLTFNHGTNHNY